LILADGQEVHYSNNRGNIFDFSWTMKGNHVLKVVAHASPPLSPTPGFRQYDFFVNGQSFFNFPKVFRLGLAAGDPRGAASPTSPAGMAESSRRAGAPGSRRSGSVGSSGNIASMEAPGNPDEVSGKSVGLRFLCSRVQRPFTISFVDVCIGGSVLAGSHPAVSQRRRQTQACSSSLWRLA
jgi:hypothetical protein